jgi:hypothetical protein
VFVLNAAFLIRVGSQSVRERTIGINASNPLNPLNPLLGMHSRRPQVPQLGTIAVVETFPMGTISLQEPHIGVTETSYIDLVVMVTLNP